MKNRTGNVKKSAFLITFFLLFAASAAYASGIASLHEKVFSYIDNNKETKSLIGKHLWFSSPEKSQPEVEAYAYKIANSKAAVNSMGEYAVLAYGEIYTDESYISLEDENTGITEKFGLVDHIYEYYFTDLVFIQEKYEEALIDLYFFKAENSFNLKTIDEVIQGTYWIAEQNGVTLNPDKVQEKYLQQLNVRLNNLEKCLESLDDNDFFPGIKKYAKGISKATYQYYANPSEINQINMWNTINGLVGTYFREGSKGSRALEMVMREMSLRSGLDFPELPKNLQVKKTASLK